MAGLWPFVPLSRAAIPRGRPRKKHANSSKTPSGCMSKADLQEMSRYTGKWARIRCGSWCDPEASFVQFPPGDFHPEEAWLCRSEEHTSELQSPCNLVCRLLLEKKKDRSMECIGMA